MSSRYHVVMSCSIESVLYPCTPTVELSSPHLIHGKRWPNAALLLGQRLRRWPNTKPALGERVLFAVMVKTDTMHPLHVCAPVNSSMI